jgi:hypothetical protein
LVYFSIGAGNFSGIKLNIPILSPRIRLTMSSIINVDTEWYECVDTKWYECVDTKWYDCVDTKWYDCVGDDWMTARVNFCFLYRSRKYFSWDAREQGCQIFLGTWYQNWKNVPNLHKIYQNRHNLSKMYDKIFQMAI